MYYKSYLAANKAAQSLRKQYDPSEIMVKVEVSPYGGYSIRLVPVDMMIDNLSSMDAPPKNAQRITACC